MLDVQCIALDNAINSLKSTVTSVVDPHRTAGKLLTWQLIHSIEQEVLRTLDMNDGISHIFRRIPAMHYPVSSEPVDFGNSNAIPMIFSMIFKAYRRCH